VLPLKTSLLALLIAVPAYGADYPPRASDAFPTPGASDPSKKDSTITDNYGNRRGRIDSSGDVYDNYGNRVGRIDNGGVLFDNYGNRKGKVSK
jgi:hypothetical protein